MSVYSGPEITDSGLVLCLDAGNPTSYPINMPTQVEYLVVAGGGGGGGGQTGGLRSGGGGGAGGVLTGFTTLTNQVYNIVVGSGGTAGAADNAGSTGQPSSAFGFTALGGGAGAGAANGASTTGGSGGGGGGVANLESGAAGTAGQGTQGGTGVSVSPFSGGGGGGSSVPGLGAGGGSGLASSITGTATFYGGGGSGGNSIAGGAGGGAGGGGAGGGVLTIGTLLNVTLGEIGFVSSRYIFQIDCPAPNTSPPYTTLAAVTPGTVVTLVRGGGNVSVTVGGVLTQPSLNRVIYDPVTGYAGPNVTGTQVLLPSGSSSGGSAGSAGTVNTGGGGGGAGGQNATSFSGGAGGSGVVIVRYPGAQQATGGTVTTSGGFTIHTFTASGTFAPLTWRDVSGQNNNGTLVNNPGYNSANSGSIVLDGVDDYVSTELVLPSPATRGTTFDIIFRNNDPTSSFEGLIGASSDLVSGFSIGFFGGQTTIGFTYNGSGQRFEQSWVYDSSVISQGTFIFSGRTITAYRNGSLISTFTAGFDAVANSNGMQIGRNLQGGWNVSQVNIYSVKVYNTALTADEVNQNFQALRGRYGI